MMTYHGYNNGYNNPVYDVHKNMGAHNTWQNTVLCMIICHLFKVRVSCAADTGMYRSDLPIRKESQPSCEEGG